MSETPEQWYARVTSRDGILRTLSEGLGNSTLPDSPARAKLKREGLIRSWRQEGITKHKGSAWSLTETGRAAAIALRDTPPIP